MHSFITMKIGCFFALGFASIRANNGVWGAETFSCDSTNISWENEAGKSKLLEIASIAGESRRDVVIKDGNADGISDNTDLSSPLVIINKNSSHTEEKNDVKIHDSSAVELEAGEFPEKNNRESVLEDEADEGTESKNGEHTSDSAALGSHLLIVNANSGRRIYSQENEHRGDGVGADAGGRVYSDQRWNFRRTSCPRFSSLSNDCYYIVNNASKRVLYAENGVSWEAGVGASTILGDDRKWKLLETHFEGRRAFIIQNALSGRALYAQKEEEWDDGFGAGPSYQKGYFEDNYWTIDGL